MTETAGPNRIITKHYCTGMHVVLGILEDAIVDAQVKGKKNVVRLCSTAMGLLRKAVDMIQKEWAKSAANASAASAASKAK